MTNQNDEIFAKFAVNFALKVLARNDYWTAEQDRIQAEINALYSQQLAHAQFPTQNLQNAALSNQSNSQHAANQINSQMSAGQIHPQLAAATSYPVTPKSRTHSLMTASLFDPFGLVTSDELEVIRAYKNGENVLTTILAQER